MKFVYWFAFYNLNSPTVRYRGKYTTDFLAKNYGIPSWLILPGHDLATLFRFLRAYLSALLFPKKDALIVIQSVYRRSFYPSALKWLVKLRPNICFYDMDDADYLRYPPENIYYFIQHCSTVTLGSTELVKNLTRYNQHCKLITCPVPDMNIVKPGKNEILTIGWIGDFQKTHKESMIHTFFPALENLPFKARLILMGVVKEEEKNFLRTYFSGYTQLEVEIPEHINWLDEEAIQRKIAGFDIGIATLLDDEFSRSKSAFKLKQCLNNGVPVLSSNIAENNLFLDHGRNGYLCETSSDFRERLIEFHEMDRERYQEFSNYARSCVSRFDLKSFCDDLIETYQIRVKNKKDEN